MAEIKYSANEDIHSAVIKDIAPEMEVKFFPYRLVNILKDEALLSENTYTIATVVNEGGPKDINAHPEYKTEGTVANKSFFTALASVNSRGVLEIASETSTFGTRLSRELEFTIITNDYTTPHAEEVFVYTVNEPYNQQDFEDGLQKVYYASSINPADHYIELTSDLNNNIEENKLTEMRMTDIRNLEKSFNKARITFTEVAPSIDRFDKMTLSMSKSGLLNFLKGKSVDSATEVLQKTDVHFNTTEQVVPWKFSPTDIQDKLTMYGDWFDHNNVMWIDEIKSMKDSKGEYLPKKINEIFPDTRVVQLIEDIIAVSYLFATDFQNLPRYTAADAKDAAGIRAGQLKADTKIGWAALDISAMTGNKASDVIDTLYEKYIRQYPSDTKSYQSAQIRTFINAISRYVLTKYATGKGGTDYHTGLLPWFLEPENAISISVNGVDYRYDSDTEWRINSEYVNPRTLKPVDTIELSNIKEIKADRVFDIPNIGETISPIAKIPFPGDVNTQSSVPLQYVFYSGYSDDVYSKLYLDDVAGTDISVGTNIPVRTLDFSDSNLFDFTKARSVTELDSHLVTTFLDNNPNVVAADVHAKGDGKLVIVASAKTRYYSATNNKYGSFIPGHQTPGGTNTKDTNVLMNQMQQVLNTYPGYWKNTVVPWAEAQGIVMKAVQNSPSNEYLIWRLSNPTDNYYGPLADRAKIIAMFAKDDSPLKIWDGSQTINLFDITDIQYLDKGGAATAIGSVNIVQNSPHIEGNIISNKVIFGVNLNPTERKTIFDKLEWYDHVNAVDKTFENSIKIAGDKRANHVLKELIVGGVWSDYFDIKFGDDTSVRIPSFNKDKETVGIQRILFV